MVKGKDKVIIDESIRRLECRLREELRTGQMKAVVTGNLPDHIMHIIEQHAPWLAAHMLIVAMAKWN